MTGGDSRGSSSRRRVLLLGGKPDGAVDALRELGLDITCVAGHKHARSLACEPGITRAISVNDPANVEDVLLGLHRNGLDPRAFDVVTSALEYGLVAAAVLGELFAITCLPVHTAVLLRDKPSQKAALSAAGVPVVENKSFCDVRDVVATIDAVGGLPVVIKPPDGAGARDTLSLSTFDDVDRWVAGAGNGSWLCEKFVSGEELHVDGVVRAGRVVDMTVSQYFAPMLSIHAGAISGSAIVNDHENPGLTSAARSLTASAISAVGLVDGVFHAEMFVTESGNLVFSEIAGRVGGGRIDAMVLRGTGIDLHREWAAAVLDLPRPPIQEIDREAATPGNLDLHCAPGTITELPSIPEILARRGVTDAELKCRVGSVMTPIVDTNTRAGRAVIAGNSWSEVKNIADAVATWFYDAVAVAPHAHTESATSPSPREDPSSSASMVT